jgi:hypothetical protein
MVIVNTVLVTLRKQLTLRIASLEFTPVMDYTMQHIATMKHMLACIFTMFNWSNNLPVTIMHGLPTTEEPFTTHAELNATACIYGYLPSTLTLHLLIACLTPLQLFITLYTYTTTSGGHYFCITFAQPHIQLITNALAAFFTSHTLSLSHFIAIPCVQLFNTHRYDLALFDRVTTIHKLAEKDGSAMLLN